MPEQNGIVLGALSPHPPILVPEIGRENLRQVEKTTKAMKELAQRIVAANPETAILISPHGPVFHDAVAMNFAPRLAGDFGGFGVGSVSLDFGNDLPLAQAIQRAVEDAGIRVAALDEKKARQYGVDNELDHGALVPLYFLSQAGYRGRLVSMTMGFLSPVELYSIGPAIRRAVEEAGRRAVLVASGDLSHRLIPGAPAGYNPAGKEFDAKVVELLKAGDVEGLLTLDATFTEKAGECGYRPILMMLGAFEGHRVVPRVLSYEGPFGVGYAVAVIEPGPADGARRFLARLEARREADIRQARAGESPYVTLARQTVEAYVREGRRLRPPKPIPAGMEKRAGVFVSLKKHGQLRGCIGTTGPTEPDIAAELIQNAIHAATQDPRFDPVEPEELEDLVYTVDVLTEPEPISGLEELDPAKYGVIVRKGYRTGLLLPDLEGIDTAEEQVAIAKRKAGIGPDEEVELQRF
ncbi:MAG: AmmeMemoRadiSam system protein A, partial [Syntrophothermus sp.]